jgi:hypothetical protein
MLTHDILTLTPVMGTITCQVKRIFILTIFILPYWLDEVRVATALAAHIATKNNSSLPYGNDSDGPMAWAPTSKWMLDPLTLLLKGGECKIYVVYLLHTT